MAYVITEPCRGCKFTDCVEDCPTDSFREGDDMLFIDPETCIDCDACISACPVEAIFPDHEVPQQWQHYIEMNATMSQKSPMITEIRRAE
ncbi:indolepyruvate ferredoxin oxidoreductase subunit alpha [Rubinisphaera italica]|uniref:Ferredoxin n=1 Tax=Rubinisphaera italica TaxID=2527969 RepID=A0A5C5XPE5_9PLAN|nr:4Fe-4S dicluster domain-containing protein [Rubinisphaera italica]TWT64439.1 Ferredoxin 1 [Rubinisphaera italica]